jgi:hypothetical protein
MSDIKSLGIGKIITTEQHRDAIHCAIVPVVAGHKMRPGNHVGLSKEGKAEFSNDLIGIVDPFFVGEVQGGETFWLFLYPGTITSLHHEWTHPAFEQKNEPQSEVESSKRWLENIAMRCGVSYDRMINAVSYDDYINMGENEEYKDVLTGNTYTEFLRHCSIVLGREITSASPFSCSC